VAEALKHRQRLPSRPIRLLQKPLPWGRMGLAKEVQEGEDDGTDSKEEDFENIPF